uniref:Probable serine/threonine-protein kinase DDB_G0282963 isoform X5 n=1 Tax=Dermatophagoides pteronyssinus TaxID=6956 RepID=A0A6P6XVA3_DERPT|nr:probable serine/threonine-protein kinase DDB_G0282963 isoform X5 [Dermatophagoides pteronyssinus]
MFIWIIIVLISLFFIAKLSQNNIDYDDDDENKKKKIFEKYAWKHWFQRPKTYLMIYSSLALPPRSLFHRNSHKHQQQSQQRQSILSAEMSTTNSNATTKTTTLIKYQNLSTLSMATMNGSLTNGHHNHNEIVAVDDDYCDDNIGMGEHNVHLSKCVGDTNGIDEPDHSIDSKMIKLMQSTTSIFEDDDDDNNNTNKNNEDDQEESCLLCNSRFDLSRHKRLICKQCSLNVCFKCSLYDFDSWICIICHQQRTISNNNQCQSWLCKRIVKQQSERELLHFINAKLRYDSNRQILINNTTKNGHHLNVNNNNNNNNNNDDCDVDDEHIVKNEMLNNINNRNGSSSNGIDNIMVETNGESSLENDRIKNNKNIDYHTRINHHRQENLLAIRSDMELNLAKLLGFDSIDYSHIGYIFDDDQYNQLIKTFTPLLANLLKILQQSIYDCDCGREPETTPTEAYNQLKEALQKISEKSFEFTKQLHLPSQPLKLKEVEDFINNCQSYEHLLAQSVVNQIIEDGQSRFMTTASTASFNSFKSGVSFIDHYSSHHNSHINLNRIRTVSSGCCGNSNCGDGHCSAMSGANYKMDNDYSVSSLDDQHSYCDRQLTNDDIDEAMHNNDEELNDNHNYSYNEAEDDENNENDFGLELNFEQSKVYFPEAGLDLIDSKKYSSTESNLSQDSGIKLIDNSHSWQDNWFFKKSKENKSYNQYHLNSDIHFGYMALALAESVPMLIPNPSQAMNPMLGEMEADQVSDLSEHLSETGSIVFSSDEEEDIASVDTVDKIKNRAEKNNSMIDSISSVQTNGSNAMARSHTVYMENRRVAPSKLSFIKGSSIENRKNKAIIQSLRWTKIKVPDFVPSELRTICNSIPNPRLENLDFIPTFTMKPGNASLHSGIVAQFCCKAKGLLPLYFAWYKDGHLIAASADESTRRPEEIENRRLARTYFGLRFIHRRYVESKCSAYRLIVFNDNECILEIKKSNPMQAGIYSVVAYNHVGHDWCDFKVAIDRQHFSAVPNPFNQQLSSIVNVNHPMSPRPVLRRPQHKSRKISIDSNCTNSPQQIISTDIVHSKTYGDDGQMLEEYDETIQILQRESSKSSNDQISSENVSDSSNSLNDSINIPVMPIAEREHRKWNNPDVNLLNNPYSPENIEKRSRQKMMSFSPELLYSPDATLNDDRTDGMIKHIVDDEEFVPEEKRKFFHSARDLDRYKRNYYLPKTRKLPEEKYSFAILSSLGGKPSSTRSSSATSMNKNDDHNEVNGLTSTNNKINGEKMAVSQISVDIIGNNHCKSTSPEQYSEISVEINNDERYLMDTKRIDSSFNDSIVDSDNNTSAIKITTANDCNHQTIANHHHHHHSNNIKSNSIEGAKTSPPIRKNIVKSLTSLFSASTQHLPSSSSSVTSPLSKSNSLTQIPQQQQQKRLSNINSKNYAVYSLTGRSIPKEICEQNQKNLPRFNEQNRINLANEISSSSTSMKISSPQIQLNQEPFTTTTAKATLFVEEATFDINNGQSNEERNLSRNSNYSSPSLDSNDSTLSSSINSLDNQMTNGKSNNNKKEKRAIGAIKQRAVFWEKRIEASQISDTQVNEKFPTMDGSESKPIVSE